MSQLPLAVKYRPKTFDDLTEQTSIKAILENQIETGTFQHAYLFTGPAGTGKTTSARIFAKMINGEKSDIIEIDAASNSGVENIRGVIDDSKKRSIISEYKVFIIDECHSLSSEAWQAMLKLLEESPKYSIFILCTTDPQKIPGTILSRVQRFQFNKISNEGICKRLSSICEHEGLECAPNSNNPALQYISKVANGGMRDAITLMDKCLSLSKDLTLDSVLATLGAESYDTYFTFLDLLINKEPTAVATIEDIFNSGKDVKLFMKEFAKFVIDVEKYIIFGDKSNSYINIPLTEDNVTMLKNCAESKDNVYSVLELVNKINYNVKWDNDPLSLIEMEIMLYCGKEN